MLEPQRGIVILRSSVLGNGVGCIKRVSLILRIQPKIAECAFCKAATELYDGGVPVCINCADVREGKRKPPTSEPQVLDVLRRDLQAATERASAASASLDSCQGSTERPTPAGRNAAYSQCLARNVVRPRGIDEGAQTDR